MEPKRLKGISLLVGVSLNGGCHILGCGEKHQENIREECSAIGDDLSDWLMAKDSKFLPTKEGVYRLAVEINLEPESDWQGAEWCDAYYVVIGITKLDCSA